MVDCCSCFLRLYVVVLRAFSELGFWMCVTQFVVRFWLGIVASEGCVVL